MYLSKDGAKHDLNHPQCQIKEAGLLSHSFQLVFNFLCVVCFICSLPSLRKYCLQSIVFLPFYRVIPVW